jgi:D-alanyl-D-alanine carboxypeptidase/D-alanyl-D-alanine-endopeptidase (penicillin-binding protein 4)
MKAGSLGFLAAIWLGALGLGPVHAQELAPEVRFQIKQWYRTAQRLTRGTWGVAIADQSGRILWSVNPDLPMVPASTVKLLTTGFARSVLGGDARQATRVVGYGYLDEASGEWIGRWALELNGDPSLESPGGRGPRLAHLAAQLSALGVRRLRGPLEVRSRNGVADARFPASWRAANRGSVYAPPVGALTVHENVVWLYIEPGYKPGVRARLAGTSPDGLGALVEVHATTSPGGQSHLRVRRMADGGYLVTGAIGIGAGTRRLETVAADPKAVLAAAWARALEQHGIAWDPSPPPIAVANEPTQVLAEVVSPPFDSLASDINRRSLNIGAELLLRWAAPDSGPRQLSEHVQQVAGVVGGTRLVDGSGMSHEDRVTPATFISYLANFPATPAGRNFPSLLPENGEGTLARLASGLPGQGVVRAKTGTLSGVSSLVGYLGRRDGVWLVSLLYNGPRSTMAKRYQWQLFRLLGADGVAIPDGDLVLDRDEPELGGDAAD